ncbi:DUF397 domain-containing protein [Streptomyces sp. NBC_01267]|uniref:DUF397 domain-containing protein n=1 Tax=unclassified Streptomyces TaxID=2593676 RepID=UPI00224D8803|nr:MULTISPECIES: DUF397 domain-containing protein [unclassified Streptomyces]MCX4550985.1 DUF397 domain-containing protein [Streptomyces sp. NBC_01500]WSC22404.1 DUF397 domain-containing protein [Streptomyces sp. NBC_01766]
MAEQTIPDTTSLSGWRKSTYSGSESGSCVEVLDNHPSGIPVRDSKAPHGPALIFPAAGWASFITALKGGGVPM